MTAAQDRADYARHMIAGRDDLCLQIEQRYGLDGYPPEIVSVGLNAAAEGRDPHEAIEAYFDGCGT
jgi:hypothetical protein